MKKILFETNKDEVQLISAKNLGDLFNSLAVDTKCCVVADKKVLDMHNSLREQIKNKNFELYEISNPEEEKSIGSYTNIIDFLDSKSFKRSDCIVGLGGGAVTDLAGFVSSTYMRGLNYVQIPTSLLSQVDASIGGKTAINYGKIKNFIGTFYNPSKIIICPDFLSTLNEQEFLNGFAEVIKHSLITSEDSVNKLIKKEEKIKNRDLETLLEIIEESIQTKASIVTEDFTEKGKRKFLNFGHTFAHGIESINLNRPILHGHAVIIGMMMALDYSKYLELIDIDVHEKSMKLLKSFNFDFSNIRLGADEIIEAMKSDKKNTNTINLVLLKDIGSPYILEEVNEKRLAKFIKNFIENFEQ
ncbi:MAG: 3-dehydroquinate synthase [Gammaproteobacteria bacterium]|nr:3-dehydroquinate synthase [Gammaproteobacteria bacterium]|tara:strand:- start:10707 stop:11780 length:1074 start_codon:yes stop_codon:yes gene_type:complete